MKSLHKVPSTGDLFGLADKRSAATRASPSIITSTANILSATASIVSSSSVLVGPHAPEAATAVGAVASLLGGTASLLAATLDQTQRDSDDEQPVDVSIITSNKGRWHHVDSNASMQAWKEAGLVDPVQTTCVTSDVPDARGIVFINGIPLQEYMTSTDIKMIDLKIKR
jgi:hypothetical protein